MGNFIFCAVDKVKLLFEKGEQGLKICLQMKTIKVEDGANCWAGKQLDKVISDIVEDSNKEEARQTTNDLNAIVFLMSEALSNMEGRGIRRFIVKALKLCEENEVVASFEDDQYSILSNLSHIQTLFHTLYLW